MSVRWTKTKRIGDKIYGEGYRNSSDPKPTTIKENDTVAREWPLAEGSNLIESNTGNWDFFTEEGKEWKTLAVLPGEGS